MMHLPTPTFTPTDARVCLKWECEGECGIKSAHPDPSIPERDVQWSWLQ